MQLFLSGGGRSLPAVYSRCTERDCSRGMSVVALFAAGYAEGAGGGEPAATGMQEALGRLPSQVHWCGQPGCATAPWPGRSGGAAVPEIPRHDRGYRGTILRLPRQCGCRRGDIAVPVTRRAVVPREPLRTWARAESSTGQPLAAIIKDDLVGLGSAATQHGDAARDPDSTLRQWMRLGGTRVSTTRRGSSGIS